MTTSVESPWPSSSLTVAPARARARARTLVARPAPLTTAGSRLRARRNTLQEMCLDALVAALAAAPQSAPWLLPVLPLLWVMAVGAARGYESRLVSPGREDVRRLSRAGIGIAVMGVTLSATAAASLPAGPAGAIAVSATLVALSLGHRGITRWWQGRSTRTGARVVVAGRADEVRSFVAELRRSGRSQMQVVGVCVPKHRPGEDDVPVTVGWENLPHAVKEYDAQAVIVLPCGSLRPPVMRRLGWALGEQGVELLLAPALLDVAGARTTVVPTGTVPMVHVRAPEVHGLRRGIVDLASRLLAFLGVLVLVPVLAAIALLIRLDSHGPAFYRQVRVGRDGNPFVMWKFRTMVCDADARLETLAVLNESDGPLFKIRHDPRVTRMGQWLRRYSLDELPQLFNVVLGTMTLVGPRPALPSEVARYDADTHRRLVVKPGITGLWQVSGRSDLCWQDAVRLDLRYVDNWTFALDVQILLRTVDCVLRPRGAY